MSFACLLCKAYVASFQMLADGSPGNASYGRVAG